MAKALCLLSCTQEHASIIVEVNPTTLRVKGHFIRIFPVQAAERILAKACHSMLMSPMLQSNGIVRGEVILGDSKEILIRQIGQTTWEVNTPKGWWPRLFLSGSTFGSTRHGRGYAAGLGETRCNGLTHLRPADVQLGISLQVHGGNHSPAAPVECLSKRGIRTAVEIQHDWRFVRMPIWSNAIQLKKEMINVAIIAPPPLLALRGAALISKLLAIGT